ncbi:hypothetical protein BT67DRAFT_348016, partial [Trichocladium antarcticum]
PTAPAPAKRLTARQKARARLADPLIPRKLHREDNLVSDEFLNSKRDKRQIKHSAFVSRIAKASSRKTVAKRRRPSKKLVATLDSLGDALDDIQATLDAEDEEGDYDGMDAEQARLGRVRHKSLKSRPGALKRKEKLVRGEMDRFGRSLAQLAGVAAAAPPTDAATASSGTAAAAAMDTEVVAQDGAQGTQTQTSAQTTVSSSRWAALRGFISATMEQNPAFLTKA